MRFPHFLPLAALFAVTLASAQNTNHPSAVPTKEALDLALPESCPVGVEMRHGESFLAQRVAKDPERPFQRVHLTFRNPSIWKIVEVRFTVYGYTNRLRTFTLVSAEPDASRKITLPIEIEAKGEGTHELTLPGFSALSSLELDSLRYADGSTWKGAKGHACVVYPGAMMLVSANR
jgi:hypothetical protein